MIVTQCWDDGVVDDIRVGEILRKYNAKGTFNLNPGLHKKSRELSWNFKSSSGISKEVYRIGTEEFKSVYAGFDIAGHSMTHPRPPAIPLENWRTEVADCKKWLEDFFGFEVRGFAYPFGQYSDPVKEVVRECGHTYARTVKNVDKPFPPDDPMELHSHCHFLSPDLMSKFEKVRNEDGIFYFWGHSYELCSEEMWSDFENKTKTMSETPGVEWKFIADLI
jgi:peptidoglycan/xylan/chitin deacetylase (PgdA/CDA1 family)